MSKHIVLNLNARSINSAIREVERYRTGLEAKSQELSKRLAAMLEAESSSGFASATADTWYGGSRTANVSVTVSSEGNVSIVEASGEDAFWAEFGAGIYYNGPEPYPSPPGRPAGVAAIGTFGKGKGKQASWGFIGDDGRLHITHGNPASMPMYTAFQKTIQEVVRVAQEVFR